MSDTREKFSTVSLPTDVTNYLNWAKTQVAGAENISCSSIVQVICRWAMSNPDYLNMCILSATNDPHSRKEKKRNNGY